MKLLQKLLSQILTYYFTKRVSFCEFESLDEEGIFLGQSQDQHSLIRLLLAGLTVSLVYQPAAFVASLLTKSQDVSEELLLVHTICLSVSFSSLFSFYLFNNLHQVPVFLHKKLPNKPERVKAVVEAVKAANKQVNTPTQSHQLFFEYQELGGKKFCSKYFNTTAAGFIHFMDQRVSIDPLFLNYALSIPRRQEFSVDSLRKIFLAYTGDVKMLSPLDLNLAFSNYSLKEIETIFTNPGERQHLQKLSQISEPLPVARTFSDLVSKQIPAELEMFNNNLQGFHFQILKTQMDHSLVGEEFGNCIGDLFYQQSNVVIARKNNQKTAMEFKNHQLIQMSGPGRSLSFHRAELVDLLIAHKFKIKSSTPMV